jgi:hypothetical protein
VRQFQGLYLFKSFATVPVVRPGDVLPDGTLVTVSDLVNGHHLNNAGEISFLAQLNTGVEAIYVITLSVAANCRVANTGILPALPSAMM